MKLTRNLKKHLLPVCLVLAFALLLGLTLNLYKPLKQLTQKKVPNPENVLIKSDFVWASNVSRDGITCHRNDDGSWHIFGTSTAATGLVLNVNPFFLESGKMYSFSSGMKHDGAKSYYMSLKSSDNNYYLGDLDPIYTDRKDLHFGVFTASDLSYSIIMSFPAPGVTIDENVYPCLVEGTEPGDFYTYK